MSPSPGAQHHGAPLVVARGAGVGGGTRLGLTVTLAVATLVLQPVVGCASSRAHPPDMALIAREVTRTLADTLADSYVDAQAGTAMAEHLRIRVEAGAYDAIAPDQSLASVLEGDIRGIVDDRHVGVSFDPARVNEPASPPPRGPAPAPSAEMLESMRRDCAALVTPTRIGEDVGQLKVDAFLPPEPCAPTFTEAFERLRGTRALIIDLRENRGGTSTGVALLLSFVITGPPQRVNTIEFRSGEREETLTRDLGEAAYGSDNSVFVLVSQNTFSAGEEFAYDIQAMRRAVVIGEVTGGGANPGGVAVLGQGFQAFVPTGRAINAITGANWEGVGVQPDVAAAAEDALETALRMARSR